jgi:hypothetical protein
MAPGLLIAEPQAGADEKNLSAIAPESKVQE